MGHEPTSAWLWSLHCPFVSLLLKENDEKVIFVLFCTHMQVVGGRTLVSIYNTCSPWKAREFLAGPSGLDGQNDSCVLHPFAIEL